MEVPDVGPLDAKIMLVGEAPGREEAEHGKPFIGASGRVLKSMLQHSNIDYNKCYVTNVVPKRPPNNNFNHYYTDKHKRTPYLEECQEKLRNKILKLKPNVVVALGSEALKALTNRSSIKVNRGCPIKTLNTTVLPTYHPSAVLRCYQVQRRGDEVVKRVPLLPIVEMDLIKAKKYSLNGYAEPKVSIKLSPTIEDVIAFLSKITNRVAFDLETVNRSIRCIGLATGLKDNPKAIVIPFISFQQNRGFKIIKGAIKLSSKSTQSGTSYWTMEEELIVLDAINKLFSNKNLEVVGQNSMSFDEPLLKSNFGISIANHYLDTMHAHHDLYSELPMNLDFLCSMYTDFPNYWISKVTENDISEWTYCAMDAITTYVCSYKIEENLRYAEMTDYYFKHRRLLALALTDAQIEGLEIDLERRNVLLKEQRELLKQLEDKINKIAKTTVNPNSYNQVSDLLYNRMKLPPVKEKGKITTSEKALRILERKFPNEPVLEAIIMYRKTKKLISTYLMATLDEDGKLRTNWNPSGTKSGRISSSKPIWGNGLQMQNIPKGYGRGIVNIRDIFIAGKDNVFIVGDLKQAN